MTTPRCRWTRDNFSSYKASRLDKGESDLMFAHLMVCEGCRQLLWEPEIDKFRASLKGGAWLADRAISHRSEQYGHIPMALAASSKGSRAQVGHARGIALLGDDRSQRVDVFCHATLVGGSPGAIKMRLPPALRLGGMADPFKPVEEALLSLLPRSLPPVAVEVALDAAGPLPRQLLLAGDSLQLPVAIAAASAWLDMAVRADRIFTGALRGDGLLLEVGDLAEKVYLTPPGSRLVVPARNTLSPAWHAQVLVASDLVQALDHAGATLPAGGLMSVAMAGAPSAVSAVRATLERIPAAGIVLALPEGNPTGAPLWYLSSRGGLIALVPGGDNQAQEAIAAVRRAADHLRDSGAMARDRVPFALRGFAVAPEGERSDSADVLDARAWLHSADLAARLHAPVQGRGLLPFATALSVAEALWSWAGGAPAAWEHAVPAEPPPAARMPSLRAGKIRRQLRSGVSGETRLPEPGPALWCDPDLSLPLKDLTRHLFIAGRPEDGAGVMVRSLAEAANRVDIPTVVLDLQGGLASLAIPASRTGLAAVAERLPGTETWLQSRVDARKPLPGEPREDVATVPVRITWASGDPADPLALMPEDGLGPELWVVDAHRRPRALKAQLLERWARRLGRVSTQTVHPGRPHTLFVINAGTTLASDGEPRTLKAVQQLLKAGAQVGVAVIIAVQAPGDLDSAIAAQCQAAMIGSPGAAGSWPQLPGTWAELQPILSRLSASDLLYRTPDQLAVVQPRAAASLPLPDAPVDLLERFAIAVDGSRDAPVSQATVLPDMETASDELVEVGVLLPKVPFQRHVAGYRLSLGARGEVGGDPTDPVGVLEVRREDRTYRVTLISYGATLLLDGQMVPVGQAVTLQDEHQITVAGRPLSYTFEGRRHEPASWPYVAEIRMAPSRSWPLDDTLRIGRDVSQCQVALADRKSQSDLIWAGGDTRPKGAEAITLDAIYASGLHGELSPTDEGFSLSNLSSRTDIYVRRGAQLLTLAASAEAFGLTPGDEILIGQRVFRWSQGD